MAKALYDFTSEQTNELNIHSGELVQVVSKEGNGKLFTITTRHMILY